MDGGAPGPAQGPAALVGGWWGPASADVMSQLCRVCGEPAAGFHFGAFTCEGCKSFFGRTYNNLGSISECKNQGACVINKKNRTSCKACRLRKCLLVGMSKSGSRYGRRSNWFKIHCLLQEQQHQHQQQQQQQGGSGQPGSPQPLSLPFPMVPAPGDSKASAKSCDPANGKPEDGVFGAPGFPGVLWAGRPLVQQASPHPPPHLPPLPFLGPHFLPHFNGGPPMFPMAPRPEWTPRLSVATPSSRAPSPPPRTPPTPPPPRRPQPRGALPAPRGPPSPRLAASPVQELPMDLSRSARVSDPPPSPHPVGDLKPALPYEDERVSVRPQDDDDDDVIVAVEGDERDDGSDSGVSERESDRVGDGEGEGDDSPLGAGSASRPALVVPSPLDLSSRA